MFFCSVCYEGSCSWGYLQCDGQFLLFGVKHCTQLGMPSDLQNAVCENNAHLLHARDMYMQGASNKRETAIVQQRNYLIESINISNATS
jgi:hypothetical protein